MIIILNGALGVGKTETSEHLTQFFDRAVMLDGDTLCVVQPFDLHDPARVDYLYKTIFHLVKFHIENGYKNFVVNYVFESPESLGQLRTMLFALDDETYAFRLVCDDVEMERRIRTRNPGIERLAWELGRYKELKAIQESASDLGDMGIVIETTHLSAKQAAQMIWESIHEVVEIVPYNPKWEALFAEEEKRIREVLGELALEIHHIGSTAIDGIPAKPVIDIALVVRQLSDGIRCIQPLKGLGYIFNNHPQNTDRMFFRKGSPRTHHVHIMAQDTKELNDHLLFRDALRRRQDLCDEYAALKNNLMEQHKNRRTRYSESKGEFVQKVLKSVRQDEKEN